jgi:hypothetical protein
MRRDKRVERRNAANQTGPPTTERRVSRVVAQNRKGLSFRANVSIGQAINELPTVGRRVAAWAAVVLVILLITALALWGLAAGVNRLARMSAARHAATATPQDPRARDAREDLLVIGVKDGQAKGFLAMRADAAAQKVYGIAILDDAFVQVPGQGFERIGDSFAAGPDVSMSTVSNFLSVPFERYATVDFLAYQRAIKRQDVSHVLDTVIATNIGDDALRVLQARFRATKSANVAIAPLPVRPVAVGDVKYFEPQRDQLAELVSSWWGVKTGASDTRPRVIIYNGSGAPGAAGTAAQRLISAGFLVVDTKNADRFDYKVTQIVLYKGDVATATRAKALLGVGQVVRSSSDQNLTDIIVIVGKDFASPGRGD